MIKLYLRFVIIIGGFTFEEIKDWLSLNAAQQVLGTEWIICHIEHIIVFNMHGVVPPVDQNENNTNITLDFVHVCSRLFNTQEHACSVFN